MLTIIIALVFCGCAYSPPLGPAVPGATFHESNFESFIIKGKSTLHGQSFLTTVGGDVKYGAGKVVYLIPLNDYTREVYSFNGKQPNGYGSREIFPDPRLYKYIRETTADGFGGFDFENIPHGLYLIKTEVLWGVPRGDSIVSQGGELTKIINIDADGVFKVIVNSKELQKTTRMY